MNVAAKPLDAAVAERLVTAVTPLTIELALENLRSHVVQDAHGRALAWVLIGSRNERGGHHKLSRSDARAAWVVKTRGRADCVRTGLPKRADGIL
jgi:hypothetical protein